MNHRDLCKSGFTLIELLIVVAIIAILAAIAVPNFLEAQTRAKVARAKSDLRTMATAVEAKSIDSNGKYSFCPSSKWILPHFKALTTPVAYLTSIPVDPFIPASLLGWTGTTDQVWRQDPNGAYVLEGNATSQPTYIYQYYDNSLPNAPSGGGSPPMNFNPHPSYPGYYSGTPNSIYFPGFKLCVEKMQNRQWYLVSQGPHFLRAGGGTGITPSRQVEWFLGPYDATNGSVSRGLLVRTGP